MDRGVWRATVHGVAKSPIQLSNMKDASTHRGLPENSQVHLADPREALSLPFLMSCPAQVALRGAGLEEGVPDASSGPT